MIWVRRVLAVVVGLLVAGGLLAAIQSINGLMYPMPDDVTWGIGEGFRKYIKSLPFIGNLVVLASYLLATFVGSWLAALIAGETPSLFAASIAGLMLLVSAYHLYTSDMLPWYLYVALLGIPAMAVIAGNLVPQRAAAPKDKK
jgi:hypothetical protein